MSSLHRQKQKNRRRKKAAFTPTSAIEERFACSRVYVRGVRLVARLLDDVLQMSYIRGSQECVLLLHNQAPRPRYGRSRFERANPCVLESSVSGVLLSECYCSIAVNVELASHNTYGGSPWLDSGVVNGKTKPSQPGPNQPLSYSNNGFWALVTRGSGPRCPKVQSRDAALKHVERHAPGG
jgi:hypothetical protein